MKGIRINDELDKVTCKTLLLYGEKDNFNINSSKLLNDSIKNSKLIIISNSAHEVNVDNPKELENIISNFWKR